MALAESVQVSRADILDAPCVDFTVSDVAGLDEFAQPCGGARVEFAVVRGHHGIPAAMRLASSASY
jgi:hypothetical protein